MFDTKKNLVFVLLAIVGLPVAQPVSATAAIVWTYDLSFNFSPRVPADLGTGSYDYGGHATMVGVGHDDSCGTDGCGIRASAYTSGPVGTSECNIASPLNAAGNVVTMDFDSIVINCSRINFPVMADVFSGNCDLTNAVSFGCIGTINYQHPTASKGYSVTCAGAWAWDGGDTGQISTPGSFARADAVLSCIHQMV